MFSFLKQLFGVAEDRSSTTTAENTRQSMDDLRSRLRSDIAAGFMTREEIMVGVVEYFDGEIDPSLARQEAERLWPELIAEHRASQINWPETTDFERLETAFTALERKGVIARQNFTCCGTCGSYEIQDEIDRARDAGLPAQGYAFYHMQDTDSAVEGDGLHLNYGACEEGEDAALAIAREIISELETQGLRTNWTGSWDQRIGVTLDWKRRNQYAA